MVHIFFMSQLFSFVSVKLMQFMASSYIAYVRQKLQNILFEKKNVCNISLYLLTFFFKFIPRFLLIYFFALERQNKTCRCIKQFCAGHTIITNHHIHTWKWLPINCFSFKLTHNWIKSNNKRRQRCNRLFHWKNCNHIIYRFVSLFGILSFTSIFIEMIIK